MGPRPGDRLQRRRGRLISALLQSFESLATALDAIAADDTPEGMAQDDAGDDEDDSVEATSVAS